MSPPGDAEDRAPGPGAAPENRHDAVPTDPCGTGVLLLAGSSGRIERQRAELLARHGARVRAIRWFGGTGLRPAPHEVPLELFLDELARLRSDSDRVAVVGTSFGAEAALVVATLTHLDATVAIAPSSVVWSGFHESWSSHWTYGGTPLPSVGFDPDWAPDTDPPAFRTLYERSLRRDPEATRRARIPVERIDGRLLLVAGGDDRVWPSTAFAEDIVARRAQHGRDTMVVTHPRAGHRLLLPGESAPQGGVAMARGGTAQADAELGIDAWAAMIGTLGLRDA